LSFVAATLFPLRPSSPQPFLASTRQDARSATVCSAISTRPAQRPITEAKKTHQNEPPSLVINSAVFSSELIDCHRKLTALKDLQD